MVVSLSKTSEHRKCEASGINLNNAMCKFSHTHSFEEEHGEAVATASPCSSSKEARAVGARCEG
ncbi:hypothetical protein KDA_61100 [Dictyobacter alpinus]|uniref:Uncharacterized protein n=1 Tax=Dictyobacter alpinus TaxID=2014873 RepID=A0A402BH03_9CHLR|nr:hypothetical protein KDA_61100 [Dictyobacter alpinus]